MRQPTDKQRERLYDAEALAWAEWNLDLEPDEVDDYVEMIMNHPKIVARFDEEFQDDIEVHSRGPLATHSFANIDGIFMERRNLVTGVVLHEVAHTIAFRMFASSGIIEPSHGKTFTSIYLFLVYYMKGRKARDTLKRHFDDARVDYELWC